MTVEPTQPLDEGALRALVPRVLAGLVRRGEDFDAEGRIVTLDRQDRGLWDTREIAEGQG